MGAEGSKGGSSLIDTACCNVMKEGPVVMDDDGICFSRKQPPENSDFAAANQERAKRHSMAAEHMMKGPNITKLLCQLASVNEADRMETVILYRGGYAHINHLSAEGVSPLHVAVMYSSYNCVRVLAYHGADFQIKTVGGKTPKNIAEDNQDHSMKILLTELEEACLSLGARQRRSSMSSMGQMRQKMAFASRVSEGGSTAESPPNNADKFSYSEGAISLGATAATVFPDKQGIYGSANGSSPYSSRRGVPVRSSYSPASPPDQVSNRWSNQGNSTPKAASQQPESEYHIPDASKLKMSELRVELELLPQYTGVL